MRAARAVDAAERDPVEAAFARIITPVGKYYMQAHTHLRQRSAGMPGRIGYVEENILPRLYRRSAAELDLGSAAAT